ncbi:MAG: hypothetical protein JWO36_6298 [Myxococcales bacterium]|nr:hypothetical protein [Myxococcales bacterium]
MKLATLVLASIMTFGGIAAADPAGREGRPGGGQFRQALLQRFDRNHDGRLGPREKRQAIRELRRVARQLAMSNRGRARRIIRKYDINGDGNVGPGEMPPAMAQRLRPLDRDGDGWIDDGDFAR